MLIVVSPSCEILNMIFAPALIAIADAELVKES